MPSPFPGMDPYLEAPDLWADVHNELIVQIRHQLVPQVRPAYFVGIEKRVYVVDEDDPAQRLIIPDVTVSRATEPAESRGGGSVPSTLLLMAQEAEVREPRLVIRTARDRQVVAVIELLSPANKGSPAGSRARREYLAKRREVMRSAAHLVEVDLLRAGSPIPSVDPLPPGDYHAHVSRVGLRPRGEVFAWRLRDPLPVLPVPLREGEPEARLDLGDALTRAYEQGGYDVELDYRAPPPEPPLQPADRAWVDELLRPRR